MVKLNNEDCRQFAALLIVLVLALPALLSGLYGYELILPDEPREAEISREMWVSRDFAVPTLNGEPFLEKPPLFYWTVVALFDLAGKADAFLSRIPSALFGLGIVLFTYGIASSMFGRVAGAASALIMCTTNEFLDVTHKCMIDPSLSFFTTASVYFFISAYICGEKRILNYSLMYTMMSLAFMSKGFIGIIIPSSVIAIFLFLEGGIRAFVQIRVWSGLLIFIAVVSPWLYMLWSKGGGEFLRIFIIDNHFGRFFKASLGHKQEFLYYFLKIFEVMFPWSVFLPPVVFDVLKNRKTALLERGKEILFIRIFAFAPLLLLSFSSSKRSVYLLPLVPAFSVLTALFLKNHFLKQMPSRFMSLFGNLFTAVVLICMVLALTGWFINESVNFSMIAGISAGIIAVFMVVRYSRQNDFQKKFIFIVLSVAVMFFAFFNYRLDANERFKSYYEAAEVIKKNVPDIKQLRGFDLSEDEKSLSFYLQSIIPEDEEWEQVKSRLLSDEKVVYFVSDDKLEDIEEPLPRNLKLKFIGFVDRHNLFLLSN